MLTAFFIFSDQYWNTTHEAMMLLGTSSLLALSAGWNWGEVYGFFDFENPTGKRHGKDGHEFRTSKKLDFRYYLDDTGFNFYGQIYNTDSAYFYETESVAGLSHNFQFGNLSWKPFLGTDYVKNKL